MTDDWSSCDGSHALAARISNFWKERGMAVTTVVHQTHGGKRAETWAVRSDMLNGMPRRALEREAA